MTAISWRALLLALALAALALAVAAASCSGQTEPPALGLGDWTIADTTVIEDQFVMLRGQLTVVAGGDLTLRNTTILFGCARSCDYGITVQQGGVLRILDGTTISSSRVGVRWSFGARPGSTLRVR